MYNNCWKFVLYSTGNIQMYVVCFDERNTVTTIDIYPFLWQSTQHLFNNMTYLLFECVVKWKKETEICRNRKIVERGKIDTPNTHTDTSIKKGVQLVLWTQTSSLSEIMKSCKCFHAWVKYQLSHRIGRTMLVVRNIWNT